MDNRETHTIPVPLIQYPRRPYVECRRIAVGKCRACDGMACESDSGLGGGLPALEVREAAEGARSPLAPSCQSSIVMAEHAYSRRVEPDSFKEFMKMEQLDRPAYLPVSCTRTALRLPKQRGVAICHNI